MLLLFRRSKESACIQGKLTTAMLVSKLTQSMLRRLAQGPMGACGELLATTRLRSIYSFTSPALRDCPAPNKTPSPVIFLRSLCAHAINLVKRRFELPIVSPCSC